MIEIEIKRFLEKKLDVPVFLEYPRENIDAFVVFEKVGGSKRNRIFSASFAFQSYGKTMYQASLLNKELIEAMEEFYLLDYVCYCKLSTDYNFTDTELKKYRYQAIFEIKYYEEVFYGE